MENQKKIAHTYLERLARELPDSVVSEALHDAGLFVYSPLWLACDSVEIAGEMRILLSVFANQQEMCPQVEPLIRNDSVLRQKSLMLHVLERIHKEGFRFSFADLRWEDNVEEIDVIQLLLRMESAGLVTVRIDERAKAVRITNLHVPREMRLSSASDMLSEFEQVIGAQLQHQFADVQKSLAEVHPI